MADGGKNSLVIRSKDVCRWDLVSLGEVMLRLDPGDVRKAADRIEAAHPKSEFKDRISDLSFVHWAKESVEAARSVVYLGGTLPHAMKSEAQADPKSVPPLPPGYAEKALATADVRIALAGYRLAAVLEEVAKSMDN